MAAPESTKFQVNFKAPDGTLINLYASSKEELESLLTAAQDFSALIVSVGASYGSVRPSAAVHNSQVVPSVVPPRPESTAPTAPVGVRQVGNDCKHGPMVYKEGVSAKGAWKGYMCAAPRGATDKCQTIWVR